MIAGPAEGIRQVADDLEHLAADTTGHGLWDDLVAALRVDAAALRELAAEVDGGDQ